MMVNAQSDDQTRWAGMAINSSVHWLDIDYVGDGHVGHRLDIHLPPQEKASYPVVICIYGSAWFSNSSKGATFRNGLGQFLLDHGFAVVSVNHRSSRDTIFPVQIQDLKAAIRFVRASGSQFDLDTSFVGITGWSSGGHLAALAGCSNGRTDIMINTYPANVEGDLGSYTSAGSDVDAVVDWFGPTDFLIMDDCGSSFSHDDVGSPESSLVGGPIQDNPELCALANPISYISPLTAPFLIFHGNKDPLVPHCQSEKLHESLTSAGIESTLVIVDEGGHGPGVMIERYYKDMVDFFLEQIENN